MGTTLSKSKAGTIYNETGMTPRELQKSHQELLEALKVCIEATKELNGEYQEGWGDDIEKAEQAITNATKQQS